MADILHHVVRRGISVVNEQYAQIQPASDEGEPAIKELAPWAVLIIGATCALWFVAVSAINYTYGHLVATLTMVETPTATAFIATTEEDTADVDAPLLSEEQRSEKQNLKALEQDLFLVKQPPVTGKLRTAVRHLRSVGGRWARFRGFHIAMIYSLTHSLIVSLVAPISMGPGLMRPFISILATVALCRIQMVWTHVVISNPSTKSWFRRFPSWKAAKNIVLPTAVYATAQQAALYVSIGLIAFSQDQFEHPEVYGQNPTKVRKLALVQFILAIFLAFSTLVCIVIPAEVTLKRVQASMLPEEDESIVPFDRTFAGKVKPEILGGTGAVGMLDAWKTFGKEGRIRLIKLYAKVIAMNVAMTVFFAITVVAELRLVMGDDFNKLVKSAHDQLKH